MYRYDHNGENWIMYGWGCDHAFMWRRPQATTIRGSRGAWTMQRGHESLMSRLQAMFWGPQTRNCSLFRVVSYVPRLGMGGVRSSATSSLVFEVTAKWASPQSVGLISLNQTHFIGAGNDLPACASGLILHSFSNRPIWHSFSNWPIACTFTSMPFQPFRVIYLIMRCTSL